MEAITEIAKEAIKAVCQLDVLEGAINEYQRERLRAKS